MDRKVQAETVEVRVRGPALQCRSVILRPTIGQGLSWTRVVGDARAPKVTDFIAIVAVAIADGPLPGNEAAEIIMRSLHPDSVEDAGQLRPPRSTVGFVVVFIPVPNFFRFSSAAAFGSVSLSELSEVSR